jgi:hypothetical protein
MKDSTCWQLLTKDEKIEIENIFIEKNMTHLLEKYKSYSSLDFDKMYKKNYIEMFLLKRNISIKISDFIEIKNEVYFDFSVLKNLNRYDDFLCVLFFLNTKYVFIFENCIYISYSLLVTIDLKGGLENILNELKEESNQIYDSKQKTYLMLDSKGYVKIGKSINPYFREKTLQSENITISLFAVCDKNIESLLHKKYKDKRVRGEWFVLSNDEILDIINEYSFKIKESEV